MKDKYAGMTMNERLYTARLLEEFEKAILENDIEKLIDIYMQVGVDKEGAIESVNTLIKHSSSYIKK